MLKATEQNDKLKRAIILSIALHCVLIAVLIWSSIHQPQETSAGGGGGSSIDAVMVDPGAVVQQYNRQQQQQIDAQRAQQQRLKALEKQRLDAQEAAEAQQRQQAEQQKQAEEAAKQAEAAAAQAEAEAAAQAKAAAAAKQQAEAEVKKAAAAEAQKQADAKAKQAEAAAAQAEAEAAAQAKQAAAKKATAAKQSSEVDDLLGGLTDAKNAPKSGGAPAAGTSNSKLSGATGLEINGYLAQVRQAISNKFYDASNYSGKTCILRIKLAPDGMLISVSPDGGDPALCQAAVSAAKLAAIPRPPSPKVYEAVKNATLDFKP
ncbi:cell envelope integrity inner membrane protein TolA [Sodalis glossinidius str. 'morsitans']|uniref:Cell envelope integrity inner membrane protein TolA n=1 Tax=Sodalis glossinidius (strain morsitans) TaxID=343509 RepID=A0A193QHW8_SODGM|nr:cell envelope integrity protein TolA [Sodalis glossinidius]CRL44718.1 cell envelope integrity inner membrane protein TolA [Sodalis glossinidius str. 'morsitans']